MRSTFKEFARLEGEELKNFFNDAVIVFDTNILLSLYTISDKAKVDVFDMMKALECQLWLPHKVAEEFYCLRPQKMDEAYIFRKAVFTLLDNAVKQTSDRCCFYKELSKSVTNLKEHIDKIILSRKQDYENETVVDTLEKYFEGKVGDKFSDERYEEIENEFQKRINNKDNCPGGQDKPKKFNSSGDYIIWNQMIEHSKKIQKNIIFVTDDQKSDWCAKIGEQKVARPDLLIEFKKKTDGCLIKIYNFEHFSEVYNKQKTNKINKETTKEVKEHISSSEKMLRSLNKWSRMLAKQSEIYSKLTLNDALRDSINSARRLADMTRPLDIYDNGLKDCVWPSYISDKQNVFEPTDNILPEDVFDKN